MQYEDHDTDKANRHPNNRWTTTQLMGAILSIDSELRYHAAMELEGRVRVLSDQLASARRATRQAQTIADDLRDELTVRGGLLDQRHDRIAELESTVANQKNLILSLSAESASKDRQLTEQAELLAGEFANGVRFLAAEVDHVAGTLLGQLADESAASSQTPAREPAGKTLAESFAQALTETFDLSEQDRLAGEAMWSLMYGRPYPQPELIVMQVSWSELADVLCDLGFADAWGIFANVWATWETDTVSLDLGNGVVLYFDEDEQDGVPTEVVEYGDWHAFATAADERGLDLDSWGGDVAAVIAHTGKTRCGMGCCEQTVYAFEYAGTVHTCADWD